MPSNIPDLPPDSAFEPLRRIAANLARLRAEGRRNAAALNRIPLDRRRAEAERLDLFSDGMRAGKPATEADPGDAILRRLDAERDALLLERNAIRMGEAKEEADWRAYIAAHGPELSAAARPARTDARARAHAALDAFRVAWADADRAQRAVGLAAGAKDPRGMPAYLNGRLTPAQALDLLAGALGPDDPATEDTADETGPDSLVAADAGEAAA